MIRLNCFGLAMLLAVAGSLAVAAPIRKAKPEPVGPITAEQLRTSANNLKQIALAWHNFEATNGHLPGYPVDKKGKPKLSWRVLILPYIEQLDLYKQFKLDEPWDSANNKKLIAKMPKIFAPIRVKAEKGMTYYQAFTGKHGLLKPGQKTSLAQIPDGTSNTFMVAEAAKPVIWTKPDDLVFDGKMVPKLGGEFDGRFNVAMCDGSVRRFRKGMGPNILTGLIDPADGMVIPDLSKFIDSGEERK